MKKKIVFGFLCLLSLTTTVNAIEYNEPIKSIIQNNTLYVNMEKPQNASEFANVESILNEQYKDYFQDNATSTNQSMKLDECSNDYSTCTAVFSGCSVIEGGCGDIPVENVQIKWKEVYSDLFTKIAPNNIFEINAIKPSNDLELDHYITTYFKNLYPDESVSGFLENCNEDLTKCNLIIYSNSNEEHEVTVKWQETNQEIKTLIDSYIKKIESTRTNDENSLTNNAIMYDLMDLNKINFMNYLYNKSNFTDIDLMIKYTSIKNMFDNINIDYSIDFRAGDSYPMVTMGFGGLILYYDDTIYGVINWAGVQQKNIIYVEDETENTAESYITAATNRIKNYLKNIDIKIEVGGKLSEYNQDHPEVPNEINYSLLGDKSKMGDYYYNVTINGVTENFVIIRDSSKIEQPTYDTKDMQTNITVSSTSSEVPLDTTVQVEEINTESETFKNLNIVLKLDNDEEVQVYDIKLYSESSNKYITKLETGEFKVSLPIKDSLKGKKLIAYYVNENGEIEEHEVTVVDGIATFTTNHFSIYTLVEDTREGVLNEQVPSTGDMIITYLSLGVIGLIGLSTGIILTKKGN